MFTNFPPDLVTSRLSIGLSLRKNVENSRAEATCYHLIVLFVCLSFNLGEKLGREDRRKKIPKASYLQQ